MHKPWKNKEISKWGGVLGSVFFQNNTNIISTLIIFCLPIQEHPAILFNVEAPPHI